jgi:hypothetical protein
MRCDEMRNIAQPKVCLGEPHCMSLTREHTLDCSDLRNDDALDPTSAFSRLEVSCLENCCPIAVCVCVGLVVRRSLSASSSSVWC